MSNPLNHLPLSGVDVVDDIELITRVIDTEVLLVRGTLARDGFAMRGVIRRQDFGTPEASRTDYRVEKCGRTYKITIQLDDAP